VYALNTFKNKDKQYLTAAGITGFFLIITLLNVGNWKNSETLFNNVLEVNSKSSLGHLNLGLHYRENNQGNKAIDVYSKGIKSAASSELYSNRGKVYFDLGNIDLALIDFNKSLSLDENNAEALANRGAVYGSRSNWELCFKDLDKAVSVDAKNLNALSNRGFAYFNIQDYNLSKKDYEAYLKLSPNDSDIDNSLGLCHLRLGELQDAIEHFNNAIRYDSRRAILYMNRSYAYNQSNNTTAALKDALQAQKLGLKVNQAYLNRLKN
jgi:tetratricopeptide (TPR) repeat protein